MTPIMNYVVWGKRKLHHITLTHLWFRTNIYVWLKIYIYIVHPITCASNFVLLCCVEVILSFLTVSKWSIYQYLQGWFTNTDSIIWLCQYPSKVSLNDICKISQGLCSLNERTSYRKISWSLDAMRFGFRLLQSLWNLTDNCRAIRPL